MKFMYLEVAARDGIEPSTRGFSRQLTSQFGASKPKKRDEFSRGGPNRPRRPSPYRTQRARADRTPARGPCGSTSCGHRDRAGTEPCAKRQEPTRHSLPLRTRATDGTSNLRRPTSNSSALMARTRQRQISQGFLNQQILVLGITQNEIPLARFAAGDKLQTHEPRNGRDQRIRTIGVLA